MEKINLKGKADLPDCLRHNKIKADTLLFKEAQYFYSKRKTSLQQQIVIDNLQYLMIREVLEFTNVTPDEVMKTQKVKKLIDTGRQVAKANETEEEKLKRKKIKEMLRLAEEEKEKAMDKLMKQIKV